MFNDKTKVLMINEDIPFTGCWELLVDYGSLGRKIGGYNKWATGEGVLVRHLCSNRRCTNPLHLVKGTHAENSQDEMTKCAVLGKALHNKGVCNEKYRKFMDKIERACRLHYGRDLSMIVNMFTLYHHIESKEFAELMNNNFSITISYLIDKEFKSHPWTNEFNERVKKALQLWEIAHNDRNVCIVKRTNNIKWK